ncbi:dTDP-4-dehydrorhamnose reductase [Pseudomonas sp. GM21]|uniref:dTDP-4-dehydrorhamnose reductase family protein n=1 Tax=Pseudomonas sp. GM21 TaxID=1144325 RepID=UPI00027235B8|nr:SDR family oxidoreductase [Pseudomonas sp. GM21]EJM19365.1 dTDP-4-dehydrorhamnose reductase [Pseudomonas sp. GM21]
MRVLVLGATGMLGNAVFKVLSSSSALSVVGTVRNAKAIDSFDSKVKGNLISGVDVLDQDSLVDVFERSKPDVVINCIGLIKQLSSAKDPLSVLPINAMLPHRLSKLCALVGSRLVHISTDCVFSGRKGMYKEADVSDAEDLYGKSKYIGEIVDQPHAITLRTSIIGHELNGQSSLVDWFLAQSGSVKGFSKAIFSGLPTVELARVILDFVIPQPALQGLYHVSTQPIDKLTLLRYVAKIYQKEISIVPDEQLEIDRSLDSSRFQTATGYAPPQWPDLIEAMRASR